MDDLMPRRGRFKVAVLLFIAGATVFSLLVYLIMYNGKQERPRPAPKPGLVPSRSGMVASAHPLASKTGVEILKKGGNAIDAAVATAFALGVVEPFASGIGGGGFMLIYVAKHKQVVTIDYREMAPLKIAPNLYQRPPGVMNGHSAVAVPGTVAGLALALEKFGTMDLKTVMEPAIELAENGFEVGKLLNAMMTDNAEKLKAFPESARTYLKNGLAYNVGDRLYLKDLGGTYRQIAENGSAAFYKGAIAEAIESEMKSGTGVITKEDLAAYHPVVRPPVQGSYRGYEIFSMGPPSSGGTHVIELLNILERYDMARLGLNTPESMPLLVEAMKKVFGDRAKFMGDPDFVKVPLKDLLSKEHAEKLGKEITSGRAGEKVRRLPLSQSNQTSHLSIVDSEGNLVALTQTIDYFFGSGVVVPGTGILLNNEMNDFNPQKGSPNSVEPKKRPLSSMSPTLVLKDGRPFLTIGMPGATRIITVLPQILMNIIDHKMNIQEAINAPRIHSMEDEEVFVESRIPPKVQDELKRDGYKLEVKKDFDLYFGGAQGVMIDPHTGELHGGADPRREGFVMSARLAPVREAVTEPKAERPAAVLTRERIMIIVAVGIILVIVIVMIAAFILFRRRRTERLLSHFGSAEYTHALRKSGNRRRAEAELERRKERVKALNIRPLSGSEHESFKQSWRRMQARFVDHPEDAVKEAGQLIEDVMSARGYPAADFEQRAADISVNHPLVVQNLRAAQEIAVRQRKAQANTEELRQAMLHYRTLFDDLIGKQEISSGKVAP